MRAAFVPRTARYGGVILVCLAAIVPFYLLFLIAVKGPEGGFSSITLLPEFHLSNFLLAWAKSGLGRALLNNVIITAGSVGLLVGLSGMAGFSIARCGSGMNRVIFYVLLLSMMIPGIINTVPLYTLLIAIKGINKYWAMICVLTANALPFSVFLYTGFIRGMDIALEESAVMDGCSPFRAYWHITLPLLSPVTASVVILQGLGMWNNYAQAVFFLQNRDRRTVPLAISLFFQQYGANWQLMAAAALIGLLPAVCAFLFFQRYFIHGIAAGALKG